MGSKKLINALLIGALMFIAPLSQASSVFYQYMGNTYTSTLDGATGPNDADIYRSTQFITGIVEFADPLAANLDLTGVLNNVTPLSYSFSDGVNTITEASADMRNIRNFAFSTDAMGVITDWVIAIQRLLPFPVSVGDTSNTIKLTSIPSTVTSAPGSLFVTDEASYGRCAGTIIFDAFCSDGLGDNAVVLSEVNGTWEQVTPSTVPVPAAAWLFGSALLGMFGFSRRKA